jgi:hypothetical protein
MRKYTAMSSYTDVVCQISCLLVKMTREKLEI